MRVVDQVRRARTRQRKWRLAKAQPDPDFKYRLNATARFPSANCTMTSICQGDHPHVCRQWPPLCASSRARQSLVTPV
jgi:hypothetical protein